MYSRRFSGSAYLPCRDGGFALATAGSVLATCVNSHFGSLTTSGVELATRFLAATVQVSNPWENPQARQITSNPGAHEKNGYATGSRRSQEVDAAKPPGSSIRGGRGGLNCCSAAAI